MTAFWILEPEVAGELGPRTILDSNVHPPIVTRLHFRFTGWLGDEILEVFPCFLVSEPLATAISENGLVGFEFREPEIELSDTFKELYPNRDVPNFKWLHVTGDAESDDFGINEDNLLVVSDKAYEVMQKFTLNECDIEEL